MYKSFPFYTSHSLSAELEVGVCYRAPLPLLPSRAIHGSTLRAGARAATRTCRSAARS